MTEPYENLGKINNSIVIRASAKGESLALTIPLEIRDTYGIIAGDLIRVTFHEHYRPARGE